MTPQTIARARLAAQRISSTPFTHPAEVVAWLGAMQAQDYLGALWAVGLRLAAATEADVERALAEGSIVRTWPMRGTLHFVAAADARWIPELVGARVVARSAGRLKSFGIDEPTLRRARRILTRSLEGRRTLTRPALYRALEGGKLTTGNGRGLHLLWALAHEGFLCFGPREGKQQTFVLLEDWVPNAVRRTREEALRELAVRYFTSHGPAAMADFAWWAGLTLADGTRAVHLADERLQKDSFRGRSLWLGHDSPPPERTSGRAHLLPAFDEFLVAYKDRSASLDEADRLHVNAGGGILHPTMVLDGRVLGTWKRRLARGRVTLVPQPFRPLSKAQTRALEAPAGGYARFLGLERA